MIVLMVSIILSKKSVRRNNMWFENLRKKLGLMFIIGGHFARSEERDTGFTFSVPGMLILWLLRQMKLLTGTTNSIFPDNILPNLRWMIPMADYKTDMTAVVYHPSPEC